MWWNSPIFCQFWREAGKNFSPQIQVGKNRFLDFLQLNSSFDLEPHSVEVMENFTNIIWGAGGLVPDSLRLCPGLESYIKPKSGGIDGTSGPSSY